MYRNFGIAILALCFGFSSVNAGLAAQAGEISPVVVQPFAAQELNQQIPDRNRQIRDEETAILSRYRACVMAVCQWWPSRYGDLVALTQDADAMTSARGFLKSYDTSLTQKYQMLTELRDEMMALNAKLEGQGMDRANQKEAIIQGYKRIAQEQQRKIRMLVARLDKMERNEASLLWLSQVVDVAKKKAEYYRLTSQQDQIEVGRLGLQLSQKQSQVDLLKSELENKIRELSASRQMYNADVQSRLEELKNELRQEEKQTELLNTELKNRIARQKNQSVLEYRIRDLRAGLQDKEMRIISLKTEVQSSQQAQAQADTLRQQLANQQNKADLLKQELDTKTAQVDQMTMMLSDYQKKLESKNNATNEALRQGLLSRNDRAQMEGQIADLSARLQEKEAQVVKIKKDMYDLRQSTAAKDMELALERQELKGMPNSDEIDFLKTGFRKAALQLKQRDEMLSQIKANADEYARKFREQSREFQSLKEQLQNAYVEINHTNEDLKEKDLQIVRLKERLAIQGETSENKGQAPPKGDRLREKLKQALDEIDRQGRVINVLVEKLHDAGQNVDLSPYFTKQ